MKNEISPKKSEKSDGKKDEAQSDQARPRASRALGAFSSGLRRWVGPKPLIHYSHLVLQRLFPKFGFQFEVRHLGDSRIGLLRWPLRKLSPAKTARRLVVTPGFGDTPLVWVSVLTGMKPILKGEYDEVVFLDFPGYSGFLHAESAFDSMDELLRCYGEVVGTLSPRAILGHSLGAWLAADYASKHPELERLVLIDAGGVTGTEDQKRAYQSLFLRAVQGDVEGVLPHSFAKRPFWLPWVQGEFLGFLKSSEVRSFIESFDDRHIVTPRVSAIRAKTAVLWGDCDTMTPTDWIHEWLSLLAPETEAFGVLIRGSGHSPHLEKPAGLIPPLSRILAGKKPKNVKAIPLWKVIEPKR
jgi:pimeloyl-ACP methyl ester carboxylesterase